MNNHILHNVILLLTMYITVCGYIKDLAKHRSIEASFGKSLGT